MKRENGFTLIELMIVIALIAIVSAIAMPNFTSMMKRNRLATQGNALIASLNYARSEAIKRVHNVTLCRSADGASCTTTAGGWEQGWLLYIDSNDNNALDAGEVVTIHAALNNSSTLRTTANYTDSVTYTPRGFVTQQGAFVLCPGDGDFKFARAIIVQLTGRGRITDADQSKDASSPFTDCNGG